MGRQDNVPLRELQEESGEAPDGDERDDQDITIPQGLANEDYVSDGDDVERKSRLLPFVMAATVAQPPDPPAVA